MSLGNRASALALAGAMLAGCGASQAPPVRVTIPIGISMRVAAESLAHAGVIGHPRWFRAYATLRHSDRDIKAGTYLLRRHQGWNSVLDALRAGHGLVNVVTVPEGFALLQIETLLRERLALDSDSVAAAVRDTALLARLGATTPTAEGYLFPDTYFFPPGTSARAAVWTMARRFEQGWPRAWTARLDTLGLSRQQLVTLASIVELEARRPEERPIIAGVYWNRLHRGMLLQADPTVQYALPQHQSRLLNKHLAVKSPYNTYRYAGLPPGPIASPGEASMEATLYPANVPYRYFVAFPDGHHEFRVRLDQHRAAVLLARKAWQVEREQQRRQAGRAAPPAPAAPARRTSG